MARSLLTPTAWVLGTVLCGLGLCGVQRTLAQDAPPADAAPTREPAASGSPDELTSRQQQIAKEYQRLEEVMLKMADFETANNPALAKLLRQAVAQSKSRFTARELEKIVELLATQRLKPALDSQSAVKTDLQELLELLLTASRPERLKNEQARVRQYIKDIERLERLERGIRGRTEGGADASELSKEQETTADRTGELARRIAENEESGKSSRENDGAAKPGQPKPNDGDEESSDRPPKSEGDSDRPQDDDPQDDDSKRADGEPEQPPDNSGKPGDDAEPRPEENSQQKPGQDPAEKPADQGSNEQKPSEGSPGEPMPAEGQPKSPMGPPQNQDGPQQQPQDGQQDSQPQGESQANGDSQQEQQQEEFPAKKRIQEAEAKMREAQRKLAEARRQEAVEAQREAERKLQEAKAELEEILRQMREEEVERMLAMLEGRFRKMLEQELKLYETTRRLDKVAADKRTREFEIQTGRLAHEQRAIGVDAEKALQLLLEEGSSIAFPETVEVMVEDMEQVAHRLDRLQVDTLTQGIEEEIIQTLEEMVEALQQAQRDLEEQRQQNQNQPPGDPQDQPLVDKIAELRMIRALQMRVNLRTQRYARLLDDSEDPIGQATDAELRDALRELAEREERVRRITRDVVLGKNE